MPFATVTPVAPVAPIVPVIVDSATINYTAHTLTVIGAGFCVLGASPSAVFRHHAPHPISLLGK